MLEVRLRHTLGDFTLEAAFAAPAGVTALFGRSGSGKTTIVNALAGLLRPDAGRIAMGDTLLFDSETRVCVPPHQRRIGYVFQDARLFPHLTVRQNLGYGRWFARAEPAGIEVSRIVDLLGLGALLQRRPEDLSGGEKQRVALGRAILSKPRFLLMDEPLAALDAPRKAEILTYLERLRDETGLPILYVSHAVAEVARLATTVVMIDKGRVLAAGPAAEILSDPATAPALGLREAGAILMATVAAQDDDGLTRLATDTGPIWLPGLFAVPGATLRLRILAQDVLLATERPRGISALNVLGATVLAVRQGDGPGAIVQLQAGQQRLLARITARSARNLDLHPGKAVFAILKAVSVARGDIGDMS
ncbi:molybdenum ABC transporter ATP-binding protein [Pararhodobacter sp.]|uniref:molybdenum ABC transporter ATP-binding protein n=1 Tax=Pararhodobacter sp. TaxID=2127056 RepID=UPI002AFF371B|nr:molybdenum ABC transporter ATP-binding protein [Pararhodobacter sp.]